MSDWQTIEHSRAPEEAETERKYLQDRIADDGPGAVVQILMAYALTAPSQGSYAGSLWALAEWAKTMLARAPTPHRCNVTGRIEKHHAEEWMRCIINAGGDKSVAQQAVALAALNGLFDIHRTMEGIDALPPHERGPR